MKNLRITLVQSNLVWENIPENLKNHYNLIKDLKNKTDLIVLPEMFTTGFSINAKQLAEKLNGATVNWMRKVSKELNSAITGSFICEENNKYFNRHCFVFPDGKFEYYDKRHLFRMGDEQKTFSQGEKQVIVNYKEWRINLLTCYDLRFPVWSRNKNNYDIAIYIANWPDARKQVWNSLLIARALENQIYVVGVNRIGKDGMNLSYSGNSTCIDAKGNLLSGTLEYKEEIKTVELSISELKSFREKFPVLLDADEFNLL